MSLELQDLDMRVSIFSESAYSNSKLPKSYLNCIQINIKNLNNNDEVIEFIERAIDYMKGWNHKIIGSKSFKNYFIDYKDLNNFDLHGIYIRFYKLNNTYHIISYTNSSWNFLKSDFKSKEEANTWFRNTYKMNVDDYKTYAGNNHKIISDEEYWEALGKADYFSTLD